MSKSMAVTTIGIGCFVAYFFETPARHSQLVSFMLPKAIETFFSILERRSLYKSRKWHSYAVFMFAWIIISSLALLDNRK